MNQTNPFAPPKALVRDTPEESGVDIDALNVSATWKTRFRLIEQAGGPKMAGLKDLGFSDRSRVMFNILGFLFGPFYYVAKGMWRKALTFFGLGLVVLTILSVALEAMGLTSVDRALGYGLAVVFASRANVDYYKRMVLEENGWW